MDMLRKSNEIAISNLELAVGVTGCLQSLADCCLAHASENIAVSVFSHSIRSWQHHYSFNCSFSKEHLVIIWYFCVFIHHDQDQFHYMGL